MPRKDANNHSLTHSLTRPRSFLQLGPASQNEVSGPSLDHCCRVHLGVQTHAPEPRHGTEDARRNPRRGPQVRAREGATRPRRPLGGYARARRGHDCGIPPPYHGPSGGPRIPRAIYGPLLHLLPEGGVGRATAAGPGSCSLLQQLAASARAAILCCNSAVRLQAGRAPPANGVACSAECRGAEGVGGFMPRLPRRVTCRLMRGRHTIRFFFSAWINNISEHISNLCTNI